MWVCPVYCIQIDMTLAEIIVYCLLPFHFLMIRYIFDHTLEIKIYMGFVTYLNVNASMMYYSFFFFEV
ncbi:hypothetical protein HanHA89_Chr17g0723381 [Helianthus annuus]|nr:hypothetical protein HanHA89_Chr17g0723381 [Helianthus annuus]